MIRGSMTFATAALLLAGCQQEAVLRVSSGWVRLSPVPANPSALYFTLHGGETATALLSVKTDRAIRSEMHETMQDGGPSTGSGQGMMNMQPVRSVDVPANAEIKFEPGGRHVMLYDINPGVKPGDKMPFIFTFANGERIQYDAVVQAAGDAAPAGEEKK